jgi:hypothetical protein
MTNSKTKYLVSFFCILLTSLVLMAVNKPTSNLSDQDQSGYFVLANEEVPGALPIEGCGVEYLVKTPMTNPTLKTTLEALFAEKNPEISALYNSNLQVEINQNQIDLQGELISNGTCDVPRITNQIIKTIEQFTSDYIVTLNGSEAAFRCFGDESGMCE